MAWILKGDLEEELKRIWHYIVQTEDEYSEGIALKMVKRLLTRIQDTCSAILACRSTPLENVYSPAELLMGCKLHTTLPIARSSLPNAENFRRKERYRMKRNLTRDKC